MYADNVQTLSETIMSFVGLLAAGLLTAALPFAVAAIASWLRARSKELSHRMNTQQLQMVQTVTELVVRAAEQNSNNGTLISSAEKKEVCYEFSKLLLQKIRY